MEGKATLGSHANEPNAQAAAVVLRTLPEERGGSSGGQQANRGALIKPPREVCRASVKC